jgi:hypothetical protein
VVQDEVAAMAFEALDVGDQHHDLEEHHMLGRRCGRAVIRTLELMIEGQKLFATFGRRSGAFSSSLRIKPGL